MKILKLKLVIFLLLSLLQACGGGEVRKKSSSLQELKESALQGDQEAQKKLIHILATNENSDTRATAARYIGEAKVKSANTQLQESFDIDDDHVRQYVIFAMGQVQIESNIEILLSTWKNTKEKKQIRYNALRGLGYYSRADAVKQLLSLLKTDDAEIYNIVIFALGNTGSKLAANPLIREFKKGRNEQLCAFAIARIKEPGSFSDVVKILDEKIYNNDFNNSFSPLADMLIEANYAQAIEVFAKTYLVLGGNTYGVKGVIKTTVTRGLVKFKLKSTYGMVTASVLNLRNKPNTRSEITGKIPAGELAIVLSAGKVKHNIDGKHDYWYKVKTEKGKTGWIFGGYLNLLRPEDLPPEKK